jgi:hypothetical protein
MRSELEQYRDGVEFMFSASVIPARSVGRVRRAIKEGRDPEPYLQDMEDGLAQIRALYNELCPPPVFCPTCNGTGRAPE